MTLDMVRGDTLSFAVEIGFDESPQKLDSAFFSVKKNIDDDSYMFQKSIANNGIEYVKTDGNNLYYRVRVAPEDTKNVAEGTYFFDLQIGMNDDIFTVLKGTIRVDGDVTR